LEGHFVVPARLLFSRPSELGYSGVAVTRRRWGGVDRFIRSGEWHRRALALIVAWAFLTGLLIGVGVAVVHSSWGNAFDRNVTSVVVTHRTPALNEVMKAITWLGSWVALVATGILLVVLAFRRRLPMVAVVLAVIAWAGENGGVTLAKHVVERDRPPQALRLVSAHGWSWPSGHTAVAVLVFTTLALVVVAVAPRSGYRTLTWVLAVVAVAAVAFSRIELGVHWTTDVIASIIFVSAWLVVLFALFASDIRPKRMDAEVQ
jgi:membrane-associated phospholipid phosphatase